MGLTIHYSFNLESASIDQAREKIIALRNLALQLAFAQVNELTEISTEGCHVDNDNGDDPHISMKIRAFKPIEIDTGNYCFTNPTYIIGFNTFPGQGCEPAVFGLACYSEITAVNNWSWMTFCKTQYASNPDYGGLENFFRCHLTIVRLLDEAQKLGILREVYDEGYYWNNRNLEELTDTIHKHNTLIAAFTGKVKDYFEELGIENTKASIFNYSNFEYLEAEGDRSNSQ
ncbi:MAG: hypothetical protein ACHBN1_25370 [Heteroscytonema crispum UTEX LB 1556]